MYVSSVEPLAELGTARAKFNENRAFTNNHILETAAAEKARARARRSTANNVIVDKNLAAVKESLATDEGTADVRRADAGDLKAYREARTEVLELSAAGKRAGGVRAQQGASSCPRVSEASRTSTELFDSKVALAATEQRAIEAAAASASTRAIAAAGRRAR